ncbi:hypothetical protein MCOR25_009628 [Pyricularia grisea]|uniref:Uncharacterized protein n=1 Tax=Pyricularia grisea TaxID=148305 RepID=A0A6P8BLX9_PYRGI|nr:uncharacterized protein PgNI_02446 [Pyricularia grisea]KAI6351993.1 hypothetical protein MCOR25_009628 [Pyricularia grisea]TLD17709.1 hypothetical protein PgNI_02446 [Pyricularia grisea]
MPPGRGPLALVASALLVETVHAIPTTHFDRFFPFWNDPGISCIFETLPEHRKADLNASAIILGLLPTSLYRSKVWAAHRLKRALLSLQRPFGPLLATLLALGSPSVTAMETSTTYRAGQ